MRYAAHGICTHGAWIAGLGLVVGLAGCSATQPPVTPTSASTSGLAACSQDKVRVGYASGGIAGGHVAAVLLFKNTGTQSCSMTGYPTAQLTWDGAGVCEDFVVHPIVAGDTGKP